MPATIRHIFNSPIADGTNTQIVRPSDWNSAHALTLNLSGTDMIGGFTNSGNISFSTNTAGYIYADGPGAGTGGGITRVAGGTTFGTGPIISFADGNNITFGMNGNTITASASYVTQTVDTNKAGIGETVGTIAGTDLAMTVNTDGVSIGYPKWLTTAQPVGAYLTTARASNDAIGLATAISNATITANSDGLSFDGRGYAGTGFTGTNATATLNSDGLQLSVGVGGGGSLNFSAGTTSNNLTALTFADSNGVSFGLNGSVVTGTVATNYQSQGAYLTTAMQSNAATISNIRVSAGTTSNLLSALTFANSNGVSFGLDAGTVTATVATNYQSQGAYLTTAMASNRGSDFMGTNTALTANGVSMTANSSGLSLNFPAFLTTAALSDHSHGNPTLALTNLSGTTASNSAGLTLSLSANAAAAGVGIEAGTRTATTAGNLRFETGNGITFGLNGVGGSVMTASHNAITTGRASNDAIGLNTALTANGVSMTANSSGLSLNFPAFLTTAAQSSASNVSGVIAGTNATGGTATLSGNVSFSNANGISFYTSAGNAVVGTVRTDYQSAGAYLTTAALSNHSHGNPTLNLTNINGTTASNSAGLTLSLSAIVPAQSVQPVAASASNGSYNFSTLKFVEGSGVTWATQANGIQASVKTDYLTTAMLSNAVTLSNLRMSAGTTSNLLSAVTFANGNGVSFGLNAGTITATVKTDYQTAGAYLTTAMLSNAATISNINFSAGTTSGLLSALTFANGGGVSFGLNAGTVTGTVATTYAASNHSHGNPTLALTNLSGTTASNSAGLTLSLSAGAGGAGDGYNIVSLGTTGTTGTAWSTASGTVAINGSGGVVVSQNNSNQLVISGPATSSIANTGQLSMSVNGATISLGVPEARNTKRLQWPPGQLTAVSAHGNGSFSIHRMDAYCPISATRLDVPLLVNIGSTAAANTWGLAVTAFAAIYTKNGNTLSSLSSGSTAWSTSKASNNAGGTQINGVGVRPMSVPMNVNMTPGEYYVGFGLSTNTSSIGTATTALGNTWSIMGAPIYSSAVPHVGDFTDVTNTSTGLYGGHGVYSAAISTVPPTVSLSAINQTGSYYARAAMGLIFRNI